MSELGTPMIEARSLSKFYGSFAAVQYVSFRVSQGQVAAFLGPNGAGKSTTLKILTGYLAPSAGSALIAGLDVSAHRIEAVARIGYLPENGPLYPEMTPLELLRFFGEARGIANGRLSDRIDAVVSQCHLDRVLEKSIFKLSKGYRQRVGMAQVLLHEPDILIMDEPTSGLDPNQIRDVRELIRTLGRTKTILLSTHILQEVEAVADHVILIDEGRVVFDGTPGEMAAGGSLEQAFYRLTGKKDQVPEADREPASPAALVGGQAPPIPIVPRDANPGDGLSGPNPGPSETAAPAESRPSESRPAAPVRPGEGRPEDPREGGTQ